MCGNRRGGRRRLFGEDIGAVSIRVIVATIGSAQLQQARDPIAGAVETILQTIGTESIVSPGDAHAPDSEAEPGWRPDHLAAALQPLKVSSAPSWHTEMLILDKIAFQYRPVWIPSGKSCRPTCASRAAVSGHCPSGPSSFGHCLAADSDEAFLLDLHVLRRSHQAHGKPAP